MTLTIEQILALAPDASSAKAAQGLVSPGKWPTLGLNAGAIWGECQGSGSKPYQVQIDLAGPAFRCSCPSRKFPCKHGLALFILSVQHAPRFVAAEAGPAWVEEWLASRRERVERQEAKAAAAAEAPPRPADPESSARRDARRQERMAAGLDELERWLQDQVRTGVGALAQAEPSTWSTLAARLVDAQLPGVAQRVRALADLPPGRDWHARLLAQLGQLQLLVDAFRRRAALTDGQRADLMAALGVTQSREEALASGERVSDTWTVVGVQLRERERLWERATWMRGAASGRSALLLEFSHGEPRFAQGWMVGARARGELVFFAGARPLRALGEGLQAVSADAPLPRFAALADNQQAVAEQLAAVPWQGTHLMLLAGQTLLPAPEQWWLRDAGGDALPLDCSDAEAWPLLALSGGAPIALAGTWDGRRLRPLSAWRDGLLWTPEVRA